MKETWKEELFWLEFLFCRVIHPPSPPSPPKKNYIEDCLLKSGCQNLEGRQSLGEGICWGRWEDKLCPLLSRIDLSQSSFKPNQSAPVSPRKWNVCLVLNFYVFNYLSIFFSTGILCSCHEGYSLDDDGVTCLDVDECDSPSTCSQRCVNNKGSFWCKCFEGYKLESDLKRCKANGKTSGIL